MLEMLEMLQGDSVSYILQQKHQKSAFTLYSTMSGTGSEYVDTRFERCTIILIKSVPVLKINNYKFLMKIRNTLTGCMCMYLVGLG